jgi:hypothetical protein
VAAMVHAVLLSCRRRYRRKQDNVNRRRKRRDDDDEEEDNPQHYPRGEADEEHPLLPARHTPESSKPTFMPHKKRVAWLDHAKLLAILLVNWNHCNEMFPHMSLLGPAGQPSKAAMALCDMVGLSNMPIFFFCSGYVAKAEFSTTYLRAGAVTLLIPCFMFDTWNAFVQNPSFMWTEESFQLGQGFDLLFYIGHDLFENNVSFFAANLLRTRDVAPGVIDLHSSVSFDALRSFGTCLASSSPEPPSLSSLRFRRNGCCS